MMREKTSGSTKASAALPNWSTCPDPDLVVKYSLEELESSSQREKIRRHIVSCWECLEVFVNTRKIRSLVRAAQGRRSRPALHPGVLASVAKLLKFTKPVPEVVAPKGTPAWVVGVMAMTVEARAAGTTNGLLVRFKDGKPIGTRFFDINCTADEVQGSRHVISGTYQSKGIPSEGTWHCAWYTPKGFLKPTHFHVDTHQHAFLAIFNSRKTQSDWGLMRIVVSVGEA